MSKKKLLVYGLTLPMLSVNLVSALVMESTIYKLIGYALIIAAIVGIGIALNVPDDGGR